MAMTPEQTDAMNQFANGLATAIFNEMAPLYFPQVMSEQDKADLKKYYATLGRAYYKFTNNLTE